MLIFSYKLIPLISTKYGIVSDNVSTNKLFGDGDTGTIITVSVGVAWIARQGLNFIPQCEDSMFEIAAEGFTDSDWELVEKIQKYWEVHDEGRGKRERGVNGDDLPAPNVAYSRDEDTDASAAVSAESAVSFDRINLFATDSAWESGA